jgi:hypothetical protein
MFFRVKFCNLQRPGSLGEPRRTLMYRQFEVKVLRGGEEVKIRKEGLKCRKLKKGQNRDLKILENPRPVNLCGVFVCLGCCREPCSSLIPALNNLLSFLWRVLYTYTYTLGTGHSLPLSPLQFMDQITNRIQS